MLNFVMRELQLIAWERKKLKVRIKKNSCGRVEGCCVEKAKG